MKEWLRTCEHLRKNRLIGSWKKALAEGLFFTSDFNELLLIAEEAARLPEGSRIRTRALEKAEKLQSQVSLSVPDSFSVSEYAP